MINFRNITKAIEDILNEYNTTNQNYIIERNSQENTDESKAYQGWIGIYRDRVRYEPYTTGSTPYNCEVTPRILVQAADRHSAENCEEKLDNIVDFVLNAIQSDRTIKGYVGMLQEFDIEYDDNFSNDDLRTYIQTATIELTFHVRA